MKTVNLGRLSIAVLWAVAAILVAGNVPSHAAGYRHDCTSRALNAYLRDNIKRGVTSRGDLVADRAKLSLVGTMQSVARNGATITCWARIRVTVGGRSAIRSTTVYVTIRGGEIVNLDFVMAENR